MPEELTRPNPDNLLARVQAEEARQQRGKLKIFLGYAAGVGKTYAMLEAAGQRRAAGVDVVVGYVETHGRAETETMLAGLEIIPRKRVRYLGADLAELDVDAILARRPQLVLVDELAHTNAPGSRHAKRYLDVQELMAAGIDVYTTLNIQHLESLNDVVAQVTGVTVRERVPDSILDDADDIELIDLPPPELRQRLTDGKVYVPEQAARAAQLFFRLGNLNALREMTLRRAADRVDEQMLAYMQARAIPGPWPAGERLLACISPSPLSERLVRRTSRLADQVNGEWFALHVETPEDSVLSQAERDHLARNLRLAEELGGHAMVLPGSSVVATILQYARQHNITKIVVGKPIRPRLAELARSGLVDQLIRKSGDIDVYVVSHDAAARQPARRGTWRPSGRLSSYLGSLALVVMSTLVGEPIQRIISPINLVMIYLMAVVLAAVWLGRGPAMLAAALSVLAFDFFFVPPRFTLTVADTEYLITFAGLFIVGLVIGTLAVRAREHADAAQARAIQTSAMYEFSRDLAAANDLEATMQVVIQHVGGLFGRTTAILLPDGGKLVARALSPGLILDESDLGVATWAFQQGQMAGRGTNTLPAAAIRFVPLKTQRGVVGVLGIRPADPNSYLTADQRRLLESFVSQAALAIERVQLAAQAQQAHLLQATEKLQGALLNSISHDLRTPLVSITGALTTLESDGEALAADTRRNLVQLAREEAERLNRLVGNLLDMSRIEAGALRVRRAAGDVQELIGAALERFDVALADRQVQVHVPADLPAAPMDSVLIVHVLTNLVDNALKYSPPASPIEIVCRATRDQVLISVADRGSGIAAENLERVFDKFYRVQRPDAAPGTGLGLAICRGIVEAHGGRIWAENRPGGGTTFTVALPLLVDEPQGEATAAQPQQ